MEESSLVGKSGFPSKGWPRTLWEIRPEAVSGT